MWVGGDPFLSPHLSFSLFIGAPVVRDVCSQPSEYCRGLERLPQPDPASPGTTGSDFSFSSPPGDPHFFPVVQPCRCSPLLFLSAIQGLALMASSDPQGGREAWVAWKHTSLPTCSSPLISQGKKTKRINQTSGGREPGPSRSHMVEQ